MSMEILQPEEQREEDKALEQVRITDRNRKLIYMGSVWSPL